jgi:hypothetical protein
MRAEFHACPESGVPPGRGRFSCAIQPRKLSGLSNRFGRTMYPSTSQGPIGSGGCRTATGLCVVSLAAARQLPDSCPFSSLRVKRELAAPDEHKLIPTGPTGWFLH